MTRYHFHSDQSAAATDLVRRFHYSRRMPNTVFVGTAHEGGGLFGDFGVAVAACCFNSPPTRWGEEVLELTRLVRRNNVEIALTELIAWCVRRVRAKGYDLLVSFADSAQDHYGGIYQAANWNYHGQRFGSGSVGDDATYASAEGFVIDGTFVPRRTCYGRYGTSSVPAMMEMFGNRCIPRYDAGKYLYWKPLNVAGAAKATRIGLRSAPYPKPRAGSIDSDASVNPHGRRGRKSRLGAYGDAA